MQTFHFRNLTQDCTGAAEPDQMLCREYSDVAVEDSWGLEDLSDPTRLTDLTRPVFNPSLKPSRPSALSREHKHSLYKQYP